MPEYHLPVLLKETLLLLDPKPGGIFLDATLGGGGHSSEILEKVGPTGTLIGIDRDPEAIKFAGERLKCYGDSAKLFHSNFSELRSVLSRAGVDKLDGALFDLGVSSHQLDAERGFSFMRDEPLDMRMNPEADSVSAADIVNSYSEADLANVIYEYGEERYSRRIASYIVRRRLQSPIRTTGELADVINSAVGSKYRGQDIHPATRTFQAIRMEVNRELESAEAGILSVVEFLKVGGRICVISFHSGEDRLVKNLFRRLSGRCECPSRLPVCQCGARRVLRIITKKPVVPGDDEVCENPRSRSAKLRCAERVGED